METPAGLLIFIIIAAIVILIVYLTRRSAASGKVSDSRGAPMMPPAAAKPPAPLRNESLMDEFGQQEEEKSSDKKRAEPPMYDNIPAPGGLPSPIVPPQAAPPAPAMPSPAPKPIPRRAAEEHIDDLEKAKEDAPPARQSPPEPNAIPMPAPAAPASATGSAAYEPEPLAPPTPEPVQTEDVRFTAFHPKEAVVSTWYTMLVYTHIESALNRVQSDAVKYKDEMGGTPREARSGAPGKLARGTEITIVPEMENVEFNPKRVTFKWVEDMHRAEFRLKAKQELAGLAGNGTVSIFIGPLIIATIRFGMLFEEAKSESVTPDSPLKLSTTSPATTSSTTASIYKAEQIFASYSHKDSPIVLACRDAYKALGYDVLIDIDTLRSGEKWNDALMRMIDRADIFQLFWSPNSAQSEYCKQEWDYALRKGKQVEGFIRPVYWEKPLISPPDELSDLHFAFVPLPKSERP